MPAGRATLACRVALVCIVGAVGLLGCDASPTDRLAEARRLVTRQDSAAALIQLKSLAQDEPDSAEVRLLLGQVLLDRGEPAAAQIELQRALALGLPNVQVAPALARSLLLQGEHAKLLSQFGSLLPDDPGVRADLKSSVAHAQAALGELDAARANLRSALLALPDFEPALLLQARVTAVTGDLPAALALINALLARDPKSAEGWLLKGDLLGRTQAEQGPVLQAYRQSLALRPGHPDAYASLITLHLAGREIEAARLQFEAMRRALPEHPQTLFYSGQLALENGDLAQAREIFQGLLRATPDHPQLLLAAGAVELQLKAPAQAEVLLSKALLLEPDAAPVRRLLAQCQLALGQPAKALSVLDPLLGQALGPAGSGARSGTDAAALALAAQAQMVAGNGAAAAALFEQAARLKPDNARLRTALAVSQLANGQRDLAISGLQATAASDTGTSADLALVSAQVQLKRYDAALAAIAALERKQPEAAMAPHLRGQVHLLRADTVAAREAFEQAVARDGRYFPPVAALAKLDLAARQPEAARARYQALLRADPHNLGAHLALAALAAATGATREAVAGLLDEAIKANPTDLAPRLALIDHHLASFNAKAAGVAAQAALARMPDQFELLGRLGRCQLAANENQQAIITYSRMVTLQPKTLAGYQGQAEAQMAANDLNAAAKTVRRALDLVPDGGLPAQRLGINLALRQQQPAAAVALAREVQQQRPEQAVGFVLEAEINISQQRWAAAVPLLREALAREQPGPAPARLHHALLQSGKAGEAEAFASAWLKDHQQDAVFRFYWGDLAVARKDWPLAEQRYQAVLALLPEHALSLNNIAWLRLKQQLPAALPYAERAVAAAPNQPALMDTLAQAYAVDQQVDKAIAMQQRVLSLQPDNPDLRLNLARFYLQAKEKRLAKAELVRLEALGDRFAGQAEVAALIKGLGGR